MFFLSSFLIYFSTPFCFFFLVFFLFLLSVWEAGVSLSLNFVNPLLLFFYFRSPVNPQATLVWQPYSQVNFISAIPTLLPMPLPQHPTPGSYPHLSLELEINPSFRQPDLRSRQKYFVMKSGRVRFIWIRLFALSSPRLDRVLGLLRLGSTFSGRGFVNK